MSKTSIPTPSFGVGYMCPNCETWVLISGYEGIHEEPEFADCPRCGMQFDINIEDDVTVDLISREEAEKHVEWLREQGEFADSNQNATEE